VATILSSKTFFIPKTADIPVDDIVEWFRNADRKLDDCRLTVTLDRLGVFRQKKKTAKAELKSLTDLGGCIWRQGKYCFNFALHDYTWKGDDIHLTIGEQLYLYRWLVLHEEVPAKQRFYLWNMRKRLGTDFLAIIGSKK